MGKTAERKNLVEARREPLLVEEVIEVWRNMEPLVGRKGKAREAAHSGCGQTARGQYGTNGIGKEQRIPVFAHAPASTTSGPELGKEPCQRPRSGTKDYVLDQRQKEKTAGNA